LNTANLIRRALALVFLISLIAGGWGAYQALQSRAFDDAARESRLLLTTAQAIRAYTVDHVAPLIGNGDYQDFHAETVPSFAAQTVFNAVSGEDVAYTYREVALNPTSPDDRPVPFETELINAFRRDASLTERTGRWRTDSRELFYLARPIRIENEACLACHSTPDAAPAAMVALYGSENGFGWQMGETIGIQIVTVPIEEEMRGAYELVLILAAGLLFIFLIAYAVLSNTIHHNLVLPLQQLADRADDVSVGADDSRPLPVTGSAELQRLARAIERLRHSLQKALSRSGKA
jgi:protein-histidine pros-kinase